MSSQTRTPQPRTPTETINEASTRLPFLAILSILVVGLTLFGDLPKRSAELALAVLFSLMTAPFFKAAADFLSLKVDKAVSCLGSLIPTDVQIAGTIILMVIGAAPSIMYSLFVIEDILTTIIWTLTWIFFTALAVAEGSNIYPDADDEG